MIPTLADWKHRYGDRARLRDVPSGWGGNQGLLIGVSAGGGGGRIARVWQSAEMPWPGREAVVVTILCDGGGEVFDVSASGAIPAPRSIALADKLGTSSGMMLKIALDLYKQLRAHGEESYPHECCGIHAGASEAPRMAST